MARIEDLKRMCKTYTGCIDCPICTKCGGCPPEKFYDTVDEIVDKWVSEHPTKTYAMDFFEHFPNAPRDIDGTPKICRRYIYGDGKHCYSTDCIDCWNREMKEQ